MRRAQKLDENSKFSGVIYEISTAAEILGHVAENVGADNVGTEELGHIKKTNSFKKTTPPSALTGQYDRFSKPDTGGSKSGQNRLQNRTLVTLKADRAVSDKPSLTPRKPSRKPSGARAGVREWKPTPQQRSKQTKKNTTKQQQPRLTQRLNCKNSDNCK